MCVCVCVCVCMYVCVCVYIITCAGKCVRVHSGTQLFLYHKTKHKVGKNIGMISKYLRVRSYTALFDQSPPVTLCTPN